MEDPAIFISELYVPYSLCLFRVKWQMTGLRISETRKVMLVFQNQFLGEYNITRPNTLFYPWQVFWIHKYSNDDVFCLQVSKRISFSQKKFMIFFWAWMRFLHSRATLFLLNFMNGIIPWRPSFSTNRLEGSTSRQTPQTHQRMRDTLWRLVCGNVLVLHYANTWLITYCFRFTKDQPPWW